MTNPSTLHFTCKDCGGEINEGEFKTFGICDDCWDKHVGLRKQQELDEEMFRKIRSFKDRQQDIPPDIHNLRKKLYLF